MKRTEPQSIRVVLEQAIADCDMQNRLLQVRAAELWPRMAGKIIADMCGKPYFVRDIMIVPVANAAVRQELTMMRSSLAAAINRTLATDVVQEIRFSAIRANNPQQTSR